MKQSLNLDHTVSRLPVSSRVWIVFILLVLLAAAAELVIFLA